jgi:ribosomal-protein-alanine N-acetyltransferase
MDHKGLTIGEYEEGDLVEILEIEKDSFPTPWSPGLFRNEMTNPLSRMFVGKALRAQRTAVVGYVVFWRVADEIHLHNIAVRRELRKRGIASRLLSKVIRDCRPEGARFVTLEVRSSNIPAQKLYESFGFSVRGARRGYYKDTGEDALIMSADLEQLPPGVEPPSRQCGARNENSV